MPMNKPLSNKEKETGVRFVRINGRIVPIPVGIGIRNTKTGQTLKQTKYITRQEASDLYKRRAESARRVFKSNTAAGVATMAASAGIGVYSAVAKAAKGMRGSGAMAAIAGGLLGAYMTRHGLRHGKIAQAEQDEARRIAAGKKAGKAKYWYTQKTRSGAEFIRRMIRSKKDVFK